MSWFFYFFEAFVSGAFIGFLILFFKKKYKKDFIFRFGGLVVISAFLFGIFINPEIEISKQIFSIIIGSISVLIFGIGDDFFKISWRYQFLFQIFLAVFLVFSGFGISHIKLFDNIAIDFNKIGIVFWGEQLYLFSSIVFIFWVVVIVNSLNWSDGINGLSGTIFIMALLSIFFVSLRPEVNQPAIAILSLILLGGALAFLLFNFNFNLIAGTSGSYFFGFILATLAVLSGVKIATVMLVVALPLIDAFWVIFDRAKNHQSIFVGDKKARHLHYRLINIGWSEKKIIFVCGLFLGAVLVVNYFIIERNFKLFFLFFELIIISLFIDYVYRKDLKINKKND